MNIIHTSEANVSPSISLPPVMPYSKAKLKSSGDKMSCLRPFLIEDVSQMFAYLHKLIN